MTDVIQDLIEYFFKSQTKCKIYLRYSENEFTIYTGNIEGIDEENIMFIDKFNKKIALKRSDIQRIHEVDDYA